MSQGRYWTVTDPQREELWRRYKAGETVLGIAVRWASEQDSSH